MRADVEMALRGSYTPLLTLIWITVCRSTLGIHHSKPRIIVNREHEAFHTFHISGVHIGDIKLVENFDRREIYAGGNQGLFRLNPKSSTVTEVNLKELEPECQSGSPNCGFTISMLKEGRNGNALFVCGTGPDTKCCDVTPELLLVNCFNLRNPSQINEPAVHVGDSLYYTTSYTDQTGLYRLAGSDAYTWPLPVQVEQRHVKILANQGNGLLNGNVYHFYIEQNQNQNLDMPLWIPRVSQICMSDLGGPKMILQNRWTSMLTARLFCRENHQSYTELLDISVLEAEAWENTKIYALFKNAYDLRAVCVYKMSDIVAVFSSNEFNPHKDYPSTFSSSTRPGECVKDSRSLPPSILSFMEHRPEMKQRIMPVGAPLKFSNNHHYTHLQVDRLTDRKSKIHHVLFMSLDNGNVHKILEQEDGPFIIAEYQLYKTRTNISSMLLDRKTKKLFVSSASEVKQIKLRDCSMYGKHCQSCVMARDPYCGWDLLSCSADKESSTQDVTHGNHTICENAVPKYNEVKGNRLNSVPQSSKFFLNCPMESQHASYMWNHQGREKECVSTDQGCLLLIDSMSEKDEGDYQCIASENGYDSVMLRQTLMMNGASTFAPTPVASLCLLFLISMIC